MTDIELATNIDKFFKFLKTVQTTPVNLYLDSLVTADAQCDRY